MDLTFSSYLCVDIDQFRELASQLEWKAESTQLSYGSNKIQFDYFVFSDLVVAHHYVKQAMYDVFEVPADSVVLILCQVKLPAVCCGIDVLPSMLTILPPMRTYWDKVPPGWKAYEFTISKQLIERTELFPPKFFEQTMRLEQSYLPLFEAQTSYFLRGIDSWFQRARNLHGAIESTIDKTEFYDFVLYGLQQLIDVSLAASHTQSVRTNRLAELVEQAKDLMSANLTLALTADEIAQRLGVSYRVLNYAFKNILGVSPYQFFLTKKLHAVRRLLKLSDLSVIEACMSYGFCTPSRFTRQYKRLFGELPSETK